MANQLEVALDHFLRTKKLSGRRDVTLRGLKRHLGYFIRYCIKRGCSTPQEITRDLALDYCESLSRYSDLVQKQHVVAIKAFLKDCESAVAAKLPTIQPSDEGKARRKPQPLNDAEIDLLLAACGKDVRTALFIRTQICSGLAVSDVVNLRPENLKDGNMLETKRQKTGKECCVRLPADLWHDLSLVLPFFDPKKWKRTSGVGHMNDRIRHYMRKAGIYVEGKGSTHRLRDTYCDKALSAGAPLAAVALAMGDNQTTLEAAYRSLDSMRARRMAAEAPVVTL